MTGLEALQSAQDLIDSHHGFRRAAQLAFREAIRTGHIDWYDPALYPIALKHFRRMLRMWKDADRREPPGRVMPPTGKKSGPGWNDQ